MGVGEWVTPLINISNMLMDFIMGLANILNINNDAIINKVLLMLQ